MISDDRHEQSGSYVLGVENARDSLIHRGRPASQVKMPQLILCRGSHTKLFRNLSLATEEIGDSN